jgi:TonB family protein
MAVLHGITGVAKVYVKILDDGSIGESRIYTSSGDDTLDSAALDSINTSRFQSAVVDGKAVTSSGVIPVTFSMDE